jgi:hypothetical protein
MKIIIETVAKKLSFPSEPTSNDFPPDILNEDAIGLYQLMNCN